MTRLRRGPLYIMLAIFVAAMLLAACGGAGGDTGDDAEGEDGTAAEEPAGESEGDGSGDEAATEDEGDDPGEADESEEEGQDGTAEEAARTVQVALEDNEFAPDDVTITTGETVTFALSNTGQNPHTFTIDTLDVDVELGPGESESVDVTFTESGVMEYEVVCRFHEGLGMVGSIEVEDGGDDGGDGDDTGAGGDDGEDNDYRTGY